MPLAHRCLAMISRLKSQAQKLPTGLVSWPKNSSKQAGTSAGVSDAPAASLGWNECLGLLQGPLGTLNHLCGGDTAAIPILRRLRSTVVVLGEALSAISISLLMDGPSAKAPPSAAEAIAPLSAAADFLGVFEAPSRHLELALTFHTNKQVRRRVFGHLEEVLILLCSSVKDGGAALAHAQEQFRADLEALDQLCGQAWELHQYFTFLDVKGDKVLLKIAAEELGRLCGCGVSGLAPCTAQTGPWVIEALRMFAQQTGVELLSRLHVSTLQRWRAHMTDIADRLPPARMKFMQEAKHGMHFWDAYFHGLFHITWSDFAEAFEEFYGFGSCPLDVLTELRRRLCGGDELRVRKHMWEKLLQEIGPEKGGEAVVDTFLQAVLANVAKHIFREQRLRRPETSAKKGVQHAQQAVGTAAAPAPALAKPEVVGVMRPDAASYPSVPKWAGPGAPMSAVAHTTDPSGTPNPSRLPPRSGLEDADPARSTPVDARVHTGPIVHGPRMSWEQYLSDTAQKRRTWYVAPDLKDGSSVEELHALAGDAVSGAVPCARTACVLRIVSGDLARNRPLLGPTSPCEANPQRGQDPLPALVLHAAGGSKAGSVTKFGRGSSRRSLVADMHMDEPIASRSHFSVFFDEEKDKYCVMDAGSKWGTFLKVTSRTQLSCGDWIRVGLAEFVVRFCGGKCKCHRGHRHFKLNTFKVPQEYCRLSGPSPTASETPDAADDSPAFGMADVLDAEDVNSTEGDAVASVLTGIKGAAWLTESARLTQGRATACSGLSSCELETTSSENDHDSEDQALKAIPSNSPTVLPVPPLEIEFISGPRTGERVSLTQRVCTLGRGETSTIQLSDPMLANVSRIHCVFEYIGDRWHVRDNGSTNGTWRRLSCVLQPSEPLPLQPGMSILAGLHEFRVEEGNLGTWWPHSAAAEVLHDLSDKKRSL